MLVTFASLPSLSPLCLALSLYADDDPTDEDDDMGWASVDFSILWGCRSLTELSYKYSNGGGPLIVSDTQAMQIRSSLGHLQRIDLGSMGSNMLARFLQPPLTARWQDIGRVCADARSGELLLGLPSLTRLHMACSELTACDFLSQLPCLRSLGLYCSIPAQFCWLHVRFAAASPSWTSAADSPPRTGLLCSPSSHPSRNLRLAVGSWIRCDASRRVQSHSRCRS